MSLGGRWSRLLLVIGLVAGFLVPDLISPTRVIALPKTWARSVMLRDPGRVHLAFPATHLAFSWSGDERSGIEWRPVGAVIGKWRRAAEAHDLEQGRRHYSAVLAVPRPSLIEWRARNEPTDVVLDYLNTKDGPRVETSVPYTEAAAAETPTIVTRAEWGADERLKHTEGGCTRAFHPVSQLFVHHTAGSNADSDPAATMRAIYWYHTVRRGWCDLGYNFVIARDGTIFEGRWARRYASWEVHTSENRLGQAVRGSHTGGFNSGSVGISLMGNFTRVDPTAEARDALTQMLAWESDRHELDPAGRHTYRNPDTGVTKSLPFIAGHRDAGSTACPGDRLYASLEEIRAETAAIVGTGKSNTAVTLVGPTSAGAGQTVQVTGRLTDAAGMGLIARSVTIYRRTVGTRWEVATQSITTTDGSYSAELTADASMKLVAVYEGDGSTWGSVSRILKVTVATVASPTPTSTAPVNQAVTL
ncbi:MAG TPA: N-acetylmuramoyl-L-alanine amidase [Actinomycetota bacterium]|nr:N-acetylmuramoyl-L-alanine amidase [Actinomycetota bacterium]